MKINYKNTALGILDDPDKFPMYLPFNTQPKRTELERQDFLKSIRTAFSEESELRQAFASNIQYVTLPFYEAYWNGRDKLKDLYDKSDFEEAGTIIISWPKHTQTIFYVLITSGSGDSWKSRCLITLFTKSRHSDSFGMDLLISTDNWDPPAAPRKECIWKGFLDQNRDSGWFIADLILLKTFLKYADPQTKIVNAHRKERHMGEKYLNETDHKVEILDSTYFTTISRTEGFGVRGHWRLQPYGPGLTAKRLQWISDFEKHGYTRKAKIISQN